MFMGIIRFINDCRAVWVFQSMPVNTIERGIQLATEELSIITIDKGPGEGGVEIAVESQKATGLFGPKSGGILD